MDFDTIVSRQGTDAYKIDFLEKLYGTRDAIPLWVADMDFPAPPEVTEALLARALHPIYGYTLRPESYFSSMCAWYERRHNWQIHPEWCLHSPMVVTSLALVLEEFTAKGEKVLIQTPVYQPFFDVIHNTGRELVTNELKNVDGYYKIDFDSFEAAVAGGVKIFILCSPHNPVGRVWSRSELQKMAEICLRHNVLILSDEIHCDIVFPGTKHVPIASLDAALAPHVITTISPSKTFNLAGLGASAFVVPHEPHRKRIAAAMNKLSLNLSNVFSVVAFQVAFERGEGWLDELLVYLEKNRDLVHGAIERRCPNLRANKPEGTYLSWIDFRQLGMGDAELKRALAMEAGVALEPGSKYGTAGHGFMRLNFACPRPVLAAAVDKIIGFAESCAR